MAQGHGHSHGQEHGHAHDEKWPSEHHVSDTGMYFKVFGFLVGMTVLTVVTAKILPPFHPHILNIVVAMIIAFFKAAAVVLYFMHQKYETKINKIIFVGAFGFLAILLTFTGMDDLTRKTFHQDPAVFERLKAEAAGGHGAQNGAPETHGGAPVDQSTHGVTAAPTENKAPLDHK